jgi:glyceraldehyde-3-phosphate dehydrogenase/erythrose-4-phosphate dehydrogenase
MGIKAAINGFGRVGRYIVRACIGAELFYEAAEFGQLSDFLRVHQL